MRKARETTYELYDMGMSGEQIARAVKVSIDTIQEWLAEREEDAGVRTYAKNGTLSFEMSSTEETFGLIKSMVKIKNKPALCGT